MENNLTRISKFRDNAPLICTIAGAIIGTGFAIHLGQSLDDDWMWYQKAVTGLTSTVLGSLGGLITGLGMAKKPAPRKPE